MASLQTNVKTLFIVEGARSEVKFITKLAQVFNWGVEIVSVCANIHMLYNKLKAEDFHFEIKNILLEMPDVSETDKEKLRKANKFAYTYLIFDLDLQHYDIFDKDNVQHGLNDVREMIQYFDNETDSTVGKIYINYPMIESYRDCVTFFDDDYKDRIINLSDIGKYKAIVGERGLKINLSKYTFENFKDLIKMNLFKGNFICKDRWEKPTYSSYMNNLSQKNIFKMQSEKIWNKEIISVLNCSLFVVVDYYGNQNSDYDSY